MAVRFSLVYSGQSPQKVAVGLADMQRESCATEVRARGGEEKESEGGVLGTWSPAVILLSPNLKALVFSSPFILFDERFQPFGAIFTRICWLDESH